MHGGRGQQRAFINARIAIRDPTIEKKRMHGSSAWGVGRGLLDGVGVGGLVVGSGGGLGLGRGWAWLHGGL